MLRDVTELPGLLHFAPEIHPDHRGTFNEWFRASDFEAFTGHPFDLQQANMSVSKAGTIRGLHFSEVPPAQAKFVTCVSGVILDVAVDVRTGSETFGQWVGFELTGANHEALYLPSGFAHGFLALEEATVVYLTTAEWEPAAEHGIDPFDKQLGISWPTMDYILSDKDQGAPSLEEAQEQGLLPAYDDCRHHIEQLRNSWAVANEEAGL